MSDAKKIPLYTKIVVSNAIVVIVYFRRIMAFINWMPLMRPIKPSGIAEYMPTF